MPRASWRGYLRLSLVSCQIYLTPATARTSSWTSSDSSAAVGRQTWCRAETTETDQRRDSAEATTRKRRIRPAQQL
jgi:non-homologous end joining protein Ku